MILWATEDDDLEGEEGATDFDTADEDDDAAADDVVVLLMVCPPTSPPWLNSSTPSTSVPPPRADRRILTTGGSDDGGWGPLADHLACAPDAKGRLQCIRGEHVRYGRWYDVVLTCVKGHLGCMMLYRHLCGV